MHGFFKNTRLSEFISMVFGCHSIIHASVDVHIDIIKDIHARTFNSGCPWSINIHERISMFVWISVFKYLCFY